MSAPARRGGGQIVPRPADWRPGGPAPWAAARTEGRFALDAVVGAVASRPARSEDDQPPLPYALPSAVLVALHDGPSGAEVVLTRRSWQLRSHGGEIAFPGGRLDPGETPEMAALREAHEEVALDPGTVELVGRLTPLSTVAVFSHIVPVVGRLAGRPELHPSAGEVERILHVPLAELADPELFREERWGADRVGYPIYFFELEDETVWGATARMLADLLCVALGVTR